ncbi:LysR family transcriptional regulator [Roseibium sp. SCP14]|uniref:LysR family transcriptional regulator n=1 Tax=Roseibium sp. SCP14 TaxID=3141375 RepID=UPI003337D56D
MYSLEHLRMFAETVETGSFSACARKLGKVQSAVSQGIASLEVDLDVELFDRSTRKPTLTAQGSRILEFARSILRQVDDLNAATASIHHGEEAEVRLAMDSALALPHLHRIFHDFSERFPTTSLDVASIASPDIGSLVKSGRVDLGLIISEAEIDNEVEHCFIGNLPFHAVCAIDHPLAGRQQLSMNDLIPYRELLLRGSEQAGLDAFPKMSTLAWFANDYRTICAMVIDGLGWAYLPAFLAEDWIAQAKMQRMNIRFDHKPWSPPVEILTAKETTHGPATWWMYEELKSLIE